MARKIVNTMLNVAGATKKMPHTLMMCGDYEDNSTMQARTAEKQGVTEVYTITVDKGTPLEYHDVLRRDSDGAIFRVTSNITDSQTPARASFQIGQVSAERWVLPT